MIGKIIGLRKVLFRHFFIDLDLSRALFHGLLNYFVLLGCVLGYLANDHLFSSNTVIIRLSGMWSEHLTCFRLLLNQSPFVLDFLLRLCYVAQKYQFNDVLELARVLCRGCAARHARLSFG